MLMSTFRCYCNCYQCRRSVVLVVKVEVVVLTAVVVLVAVMILFTLITAC